MSRNKIDQWVQKVLSVSSEYSESYGAKFIIGKPNVYPKYGDLSGTFLPKCSSTTDGKRDFIELEYAKCVYIDSVNIYETVLVQKNNLYVILTYCYDECRPGSLVKISCRKFNENGSLLNTNWVELWSRSEPARDSPTNNSVIFSPGLKIPNDGIYTKHVRLDVVSMNGSWSEIDCVQLAGYDKHSSSYISIHSVNVEVEKIPLFGARKITKEIDERIDFILENFVNYRVTLKNETIDLVKSSLQFASKSVLSKDQYDGISDLALDIDGKFLFCFLNGFDINIAKNHQFIDYYIFFRSMGLKREIKRMLDHLRKIKEFRDLYNLFRECAVEWENETVKSWLTFSPNAEKEHIDFETSFCQVIFDELKKRETSISRNSSDILLPYVNNIFFMLKKYRNQDLSVEEKHPDLLDIGNLKDFASFYKGLDNGYLSNMTLKSSLDHKKTIECHREILVLNSAFFFRMLNFGGKEMEDLKKMGTVEMEDIRYQVMELLKRFYYFQLIKKNEELNLNALISCIVHCEKYREINAMNTLIKILDESINDRGKDVIESSVYSVGYSLKSEEVIQKVLPILSKGEVSDKRIKKLIMKSEKNHSIHEEIKKVREEMERLKSEVKGFEERMVKSEKENREMRKRIRILESGEKKND